MEHELSDDGTVVTFAEPLGRQFTADELSGLVVALSAIREQMLPAFPDEPPPGQMKGTIEPMIRAMPELVDGRVMFFIRDNGLGWRFYAVTPSRAKSLAHHLLLHADGTPGQAN